MRYRQLGRTGLEVSEIGFGTGDNAGLLVAGSPSEQREAVERALELGVNYWDTAPDYGHGAAEANLGRVLDELGARPVVVTKVEVSVDDVDDPASAVTDSIDASLERLRLDHVDVLQIHNAPTRVRDESAKAWGTLALEDFLGPRGAIEGLRRAREAGKTRFCGFTCALADADVTVELLDTGAFDVINVWYNLLNPSAGMPVPEGLDVTRDYGRIIDHAGERGVGVAVFRPLAGGALTGQALGTEQRHPLAGGLNTREPERHLAEVRRARAIAEAAEGEPATLVRLAYRFALEHPHVSTVLGGFSELAHLEQAVECSGAPPLSEEERRRVEEIWRANLESVS